jgi:maltooligosyltrehalose trehalohydrolase
MLLSAFAPLLFIGEEHGGARFRYFVSYTDAKLVDAVRRGRREEFASFGWSGEIPEPQNAATFAAARLNR